MNSDQTELTPAQLVDTVWESRTGSKYRVTEFDGDKVKIVPVATRGRGRWTHHGNLKFDYLRVEGPET